jgi:hypothetical protein
MSEPDPITHDQIDFHGHNSMEDHTAAVIASQLNQLGHLLVEIRDLLAKGPVKIKIGGEIYIGDNALSNLKRTGEPK